MSNLWKTAKFVSSIFLDILPSLLTWLIVFLVPIWLAVYILPKNANWPWFFSIPLGVSIFLVLRVSSTAIRRLLWWLLRRDARRKSAVDPAEFVSNPDFTKPLVEMQALLLKVHATYHANYLNNLLGLLNTDPKEALKRLTGVDFWGGAGSFFDLQFSPGIYLKSSDVDRTHRMYRQLLLQVLINLNKQGYAIRTYKSVERYLRL